MEKEVSGLSPVIEEKIRLLCEKQGSEESLQDDFGLYTPPSGSLKQYSKQTFDLSGAIKDFTEGDKSVMLLLGESGSGKSFFCQMLVMKASTSYQPGDRIPIFISLPTLRKPKTHIMQETLKLHGFTAEEIEVLKKTQRFLLVFDAYDEINLWDNLYMTNKMDQWNAKILMTCRLEHLTQEQNYERYFQPYLRHKPLKKDFQKLFVAPFVRGQIDQYIAQYIKVKSEDLNNEILIRDDFTDEWLQQDTYKEWIEKIPGLKSLASKPFLLRITMEVLPDVVVEFQEVQQMEEKYNMTGARLYDHFVRQWFTRQENKLIGLGQSVGRRYQKDCMSFAKSLAKKMHMNDTMVVYYEDASTFEDDDLFGDDEGEEPDENMAQWAPYFSDDLIKQDKGNTQRRDSRIRSRKACPLKKVGECQWAFMHASLRDYFFTLTFVGPKKRVFKIHDPDAHENQKSQNIQHASRHRVVGRFELLNRLNRDECADLLQKEGVVINVNDHENEHKVVLGAGAFGKLRIARNIINGRFAAVKKIHGEEHIKTSIREAEFQLELVGQPNIMPIWDSQQIVGKRSGDPILLQFMPLAGFGDGEKLRDLLCYVEDETLKERFLIHIAKSLLIGIRGMHIRKMFHLDMKPANFVLDCRGTLYIVDFGCAYREYRHKSDALLNTGIGDMRYFSSDRIACLRRRFIANLTGGATETSEDYDAEFADLWAIGVTLLELVYQVEHPINGHDRQNMWKINHWDSQYFNDCFNDIEGWAEAEENSLMGLIKLLLVTDRSKKTSADQALKMPIFHSESNQLSPDELKAIMDDLMKWKISPPEPTDPTDPLITAPLIASQAPELPYGSVMFNQKRSSNSYYASVAASNEDEHSTEARVNSPFFDGQNQGGLLQIDDPSGDGYATVSFAEQENDAEENTNEIHATNDSATPGFTKHPITADAIADAYSSQSFDQEINAVNAFGSEDSDSSELVFGG